MKHCKCSTPQPSHVLKMAKGEVREVICCTTCGGAYPGIKDQMDLGWFETGTKGPEISGEEYFAKMFHNPESRCVCEAPNLEVLDMENGQSWCVTCDKPAKLRGPFANVNQKVYPYNPNDGITVEDIEKLLNEIMAKPPKIAEPMCYYKGRFIPIWQHPEVEKEMRKRYKSGLENIGEEIKKLEKPLPPPPPDPEKKWWRRYFK